MAFDSLEWVRVEAEFLELGGGDIWDRVENVAWQQLQNERAASTEKQREFRSRQSGRLYHSRAERERRVRNKGIDSVVRCCAVCRMMYVQSHQQRLDGTRFCSLTCAGKYRVARRPIRPPRLVTIGKKTRSLRDWAKHYGIGIEMVYRRMKGGMSDVEALTKPKTRVGRAR